jgi:mono/diheme cytochrome c family protein
MLVATTQTSIGTIILLVAVAIAVVYAFVNIRQGRAEVGSEIELAPNRKPYLSDEELEGRKLDRTLSYGLLGLIVLGVGLPLYWLGEPGRQENAEGNIARQFRDRGADMYATTEEGGFNCAFCHGPDGGGASTPYTITDAEGRFVKEVQWQGPALNTIFLRHTRDEIRYILEYGRLHTPMPAWGAAGGGPLTEQQLQNLIDYMESFQLGATPGEELDIVEASRLSQEQVDEQLAVMMERKDPTCVAARTEAAQADLTEEELADFDPESVDTDDCPDMWKSEGEALFNMGYDDGFAGGAYACGRCHTPGWSYGEKGEDGAGAMGPPLTGVLTQFPGETLGRQQQIDFVCQGSTDGARYGQYGQGSGKMPGFCVVPEVRLNPDNGEVGITPRDAGLPEHGGMFSQEQVEAIVDYTRSFAR